MVMFHSFVEWPEGAPYANHVWWYMVHLPICGWLNQPPMLVDLPYHMTSSSIQWAHHWHYNQPQMCCYLPSKLDEFVQANVDNSFSTMEHMGLWITIRCYYHKNIFHYIAILLLFFRWYVVISMAYLDILRNRVQYFSIYGRYGNMLQLKIYHSYVYIYIYTHIITIYYICYPISLW